MVLLSAVVKLVSLLWIEPQSELKCEYLLFARVEVW